MSLLRAVHLGSAMSRRFEGFPGLIYKGRAGAEPVERAGRRVAP